jgi:hypothetical protein
MVDAYDNWREGRPEERRSSRRPEPRFEQRLDQLVSAGRQFVDGVSGARPGSRPAGRSNGLKLDHLGRWVEDKLDWLLEDEEGWRESWEQPAPAPAGAAQPQRRSRRQPLSAISRRTRAQAPAADQDWPDDDNFTLNRWSREAEAPRSVPPPDVASGSQSSASGFQSGRMVPRSTRRRFD